MSATAEAIDNAPKRVIGVPFEKGNTYGGRPKGARTKLGEKFMQSCLDIFESDGEAALRQMVVRHPEKFCSMIAGILPKQLKAEVHDMRTLVVELIGVIEPDDDEDLTSGGVSRPIEGQAIEVQSNGHDDALPQMPAFEVEDGSTT